MEKQVEIHAYHGWGGDDSFWNPLRDVLPKEIIFKAANRGYFDKPFFPQFEKDSKVRIVFTHSFGLHWCNSAVLSKADFLVIFNGFGDFHPANPKQRVYSQKGLELTIEQFEKSPKNVLEVFRGNCFSPEENPTIIPDNINVEKGLKDLHAMQSLRFPILDLDFGSTIITIDSGKDKILHEPRGKTMLEGHVGRTFHTVFEEAGHALPFTNPNDCWSYLCSVIPIFRRYENNS